MKSIIISLCFFFLSPEGVKMLICSLEMCRDYCEILGGIIVFFFNMSGASKDDKAPPSLRRGWELGRRQRGGS